MTPNQMKAKRLKKAKFLSSKNILRCLMHDFKPGNFSPLLSVTLNRILSYYTQQPLLQYFRFFAEKGRFLWKISQVSFVRASATALSPTRRSAKPTPRKKAWMPEQSSPNCLLQSRSTEKYANRRVKADGKE